MKKMVTFFYLITISTNAIFFAQDNATIPAMQKLFEMNGFEVKFMFYSSGNGVSDNGINLLLINKNNYDITYTFDLIFKSATKEKIQNVAGILEAGEKRTGSNSDLFFLPFRDG